MTRVWYNVKADSGSCFPFCYMYSILESVFQGKEGIYKGLIILDFQYNGRASRYLQRRYLIFLIRDSVPCLIWFEYIIWTQRQIYVDGPTGFGMINFLSWLFFEVSNYFFYLNILKVCICAKKKIIFPPFLDAYMNVLSKNSISGMVVYDSQADCSLLFLRHYFGLRIIVGRKLYLQVDITDITVVVHEGCSGKLVMLGG